MVIHAAIDLVKKNMWHMFVIEVRLVLQQLSEFIRSYFFTRTNKLVPGFTIRCDMTMWARVFIEDEERWTWVYKLVSFSVYFCKTKIIHHLIGYFCDFFFSLSSSAFDQPFSKISACEHHLFVFWKYWTFLFQFHFTSGIWCDFFCLIFRPFAFVRVGFYHS